MLDINDLDIRRDEIRENIVRLTREDADRVDAGGDDENYEAVARLYHSMSVVETLANRIRRNTP